MLNVDVSSGVDLGRITRNLAVLNHILRQIKAGHIVFLAQDYDHNFWFLAHIVSILK